MSFSKKQIIILFSLSLVLIVGLFLLANELYPTLIPKDSTNDFTVLEDDSNFQSLKEALNTAADETGITDIQDISIEDKLSIIRQTRNVDNVPLSSDFTLGREYSPVTNRLELYTGDYLDLAEYIPDSDRYYQDVLTYEFEDDSRLLIYSDNFSQVPDIGVAPLLRISDTIDITSVMFLEQDDVFLYLGNNLTYLFDFYFNGQTYWVSFVEFDSRSTKVYVSFPYFNNIQELPGIILEPVQVTKERGQLIISSVVETGRSDEPLEIVEEVLDIEAVLMSQVQTTYLDFLERR